MAAVNGQKVQHLQYYNNYCIRVAILYLVLLRIGNYAERLFDSMETKNARTYEIFILAHLKVPTGHRIACVAGGLQRSENERKSDEGEGSLPSPLPPPLGHFFALSQISVDCQLRRLDTGLTSAQSICHFVVLLLILNLAFFFLWLFQHNSYSKAFDLLDEMRSKGLQGIE